jgi:hypothetical protein
MCKWSPILSTKAKEAQIPHIWGNKVCLKKMTQISNWTRKELLLVGPFQLQVVHHSYCPIVHYKWTFTQLYKWELKILLQNFVCGSKNVSPFHVSLIIPTLKTQGLIVDFLWTSKQRLLSKAPHTFSEKE